MIAKCPRCVEGDNWQEITIEQIIAHLKYNGWSGYQYATKNGWLVTFEKIEENQEDNNEPLSEDDFEE